MGQLIRLLVCLFCLAVGFTLGLVARDTETYRHFFGSRSQDVHESQRRGSQIIDAIGAFHRTAGTYPLGLYELTPGYLEDIPLPVAGEGFWRYETDRAGAGFSLMFAQDWTQYPMCVYTSASPSWREDT